MIKDRLDSIKRRAEHRLEELLEIHCEEGVLYDAMRYSLAAGGKRLRPALCIMTAGLFGDAEAVLDFACALEMIHTYSLIHDDLPAMDNDDLRRGKPTNHVVFGEAMAILAGDALLNLAFEVMTNAAIKSSEPMCALKAMQIVAKASGASGMVQGQAADLEFESKDKDEEVLEYIHKRKTAAMITASVLGGAALMGAGEKETEALKEYSERIGLVFQIIDDVLDVVGDKEKLGKTPGKDIASGKQTFAEIYGIDKSRQIAKGNTEKAIKALNVFNGRASELLETADLLLHREK